MTIVIWLVFIPSYFVTYRALQQRIFVSLALVLHASNILVCLFIAKIYALFRGLVTDKQRPKSSFSQVSERLCPVEIITQKIIYSSLSFSFSVLNL